MAKRSSVIKNLNRKKLSDRLRKKREALSEIAKNTDLSMEERFKALVRLSELPRNSSYIRYRTRCAISGRPRAVYRKFGLSRIALRELASWGQVPGLLKSSW